MGSSLVWRYGMLVTDLEYPARNTEHYARWYLNFCKVLNSGLGFEVFSSPVDVMHINESFGLVSEWKFRDSNIGMILCEQPHSEGTCEAVLQWNIISSLASDWVNEDILCVVVVREHCVRDILNKFRYLPVSTTSRIRYSEVTMHYESKRCRSTYSSRSGWNVGDPDSRWFAFLIFPRGPNMPRIPFVEPISIPYLVWYMAVVMRKRTLQTAAYTFESTVAIIAYFYEQLRLHGISTPIP
jgi:hypothetical protein